MSEQHNNPHTVRQVVLEQTHGNPLSDEALGDILEEILWGAEDELLAATGAVGVRELLADEGIGWDEADDITRKIYVSLNRIDDLFLLDSLGTRRNDYDDYEEDL